MESVFRVNRRDGLLAMSGFSLLWIAGIVFLLLMVSNTKQVLTVILQIAISILFVALLIFTLYRVYILINMQYRFDREILFLRWGLRSEAIPMQNIEWIRPANELGFEFPLPLIRLPGIIVGKRVVDGLGIVEYLATKADKIILIVAGERIFAISPDEPTAFTSTFNRISELGSLESIQSESITPAILLSKIWTDKISRLLILLSFVFIAALIMITVLIIESNQTLTWFDGNSVPAERLGLLPILGILSWSIDLIMGVLIYLRQQVSKIAVYILWASSSLTSLLLILAVLFL